MSINCESTSNAYQDDFVLKMHNYKKNGYFLDIGCANGILGSNSYRLELNGWTGVRVDLQVFEENEYRSSPLILGNALELDYKKILEDNNAPKDIDYASLDIDEATTPLLSILPFDSYNFKIITIEHDRYDGNDENAMKQREILSSKGYTLICEDILVDNWISWRKAPFEDWWVKAEFFDPNLLDKIRCKFSPGLDVIKKFGLSSVDFFNL